MADKGSTQNYLMGFVVGGSAVLVGCVVAWAGLYLFYAKGSDATNLPIIIITGVVFLLTVLGLLTYSFSALGLANRDEALGLPSGSVRAVIAIMLLVIFAIVAIYVFSVVFASNEAAGIDLGKQLVTLIGTLVTAVASFYFGSSSIAAVTKPAGNTGGPNAAAVSPGNLTPGGAKQPLAITGKNLSNVANVKLTFDTQTPITADANSIEAGEFAVRCTMTIPSTAPWGPWNVVVSDNANNDSTVPNSLTIGTRTAPKPEPAGPSAPSKITNVDKKALPADDKVQDVVVTGTNLAASSTAKLKSGDDVLPGENGVTVNQDGTEVKCQFKIEQGKSGDWLLVLFDKNDKEIAVSGDTIKLG